MPIDSDPAPASLSLEPSSLAIQAQGPMAMDAFFNAFETAEDAFDFYTAVTTELANIKQILPASAALTPADPSPKLDAYCKARVALLAADPGITRETGFLNYKLAACYYRRIQPFLTELTRRAPELLKQISELRALIVNESERAKQDLIKYKWNSHQNKKLRSTDPFRYTKGLQDGSIATWQIEQQQLAILNGEIETLAESQDALSRTEEDWLHFVSQIEAYPPLSTAYMARTVTWGCVTYRDLSGTRSVKDDTPIGQPHVRPDAHHRDSQPTYASPPFPSSAQPAGTRRSDPSLL